MSKSKWFYTWLGTALGLVLGAIATMAALITLPFETVMALSAFVIWLIPAGLGLSGFIADIIRSNDPSDKPSCGEL